ncbi:hypothetical protein ACTXT7_017413, partial [Hymenolepis weldensis]
MKFEFLERAACDCPFSEYSTTRIRNSNEAALLQPLPLFLIELYLPEFSCFPTMEKSKISHLRSG